MRGYLGPHRPGGRASRGTILLAAVAAIAAIAPGTPGWASASAPAAAAPALAEPAGQAPLPPAPAQAPPTAGTTLPLSLEAAVALALRQNPDVLASAGEVDAAEAARASAMGMFGPRLRAEANVVRWDEPLDIAFSAPPIPGFKIEIPPTRVRDETTWTATLTLVQPLTPLWSILEAYRVRDHGVDVAHLRRSVTRRDTAYQVTEAYLRLLQAIKLEEVTVRSVEQVEAQVERARAFERQGVVARNDVLRAELGLAAARQRRIQTGGMVRLARGRLATLLGLPPDTPIEPTTVPAVEPPPRPIPVEEAEARALTGRAEVREVEARIGQAEAGVGAAWSRMIPQVSALASYSHTEGSRFAEEDALFVGLNASFDVWEWGSTYYGTQEARARLDQARTATEKVRDLIRLDVRNAHVAYVTATESLAVAQQALVQAEENFRIETRRFENGVSTSFDVLDAETQLTNARAQSQTALYEYLIAEAALARAMGETVNARENP